MNQISFHTVVYSNPLRRKIYISGESPSIGPEVVTGGGHRGNVPVVTLAQRLFRASFPVTNLSRFTKNFNKSTMWTLKIIVLPLVDNYYISDKSCDLTL